VTDLTAAAIDRLIGAGASTATPIHLAPGAYGALGGLVPDGWHWAVHPYDLPGDQPRRRYGTVELADTLSLIAYWSKHREPTSEVYAQVGVNGGGAITAVVNASGRTDADAAFGDHRAVLKLEHTPEWLRWTGMNGKLMPQVDFAELIEAGLTQITSPPPADMLAVAQGLVGRVNVEWESSSRLSDGQVVLAYREDNQASVKGGIEIPAEFTLALRPWRASLNAVLVKARFRYRVAGGNVAMGFVLADLDLAVEGAVNDLLTELQGALNEGADAGQQVVVLRGAPARPLA
jgi:uncharacterized protein YfdQ (DUF2303 family)